MPNQDLICLGCMQMMQNLHFPLQPLLKCYFQERHFNPIENMMFMISWNRCFEEKIFIAALVTSRCKSTSRSQQLPLQTPARLAVVFAQVSLPGWVLSCARKANRSRLPTPPPQPSPPLLTLHPGGRHWCSVFTVCLPQLAPIGWADPCQATGAVVFTCAV